jgi:hypothetical protein
MRVTWLTRRAGQAQEHEQPRRRRREQSEGGIHGRPAAPVIFVPLWTIMIGYCICDSLEAVSLNGANG